MHDTPTHDKDSTILQLSALAEIAGDIVACLSADGRCSGSAGAGWTCSA